MADKKGDDDPRKKRTIEFDWFVRDLEPEQDEKIRGAAENNLSQRRNPTKTGDDRDLLRLR